MMEQAIKTVEMNEDDRRLLEARYRALDQLYSPDPKIKEDAAAIEAIFVEALKNEPTT